MSKQPKPHQAFPQAPVFALERWFAQHEFSTRWLLGCSDCESVTVGDLLALEPGARLDQVWLGYTESLGAPALREAIASLYERIDPDQVLVYVGAQEAIHGFMHAVLAPGDHLVVHMPAYASLHQVAEARGCRVSPWRAREAEGWRLDLGDLEACLTPTTRAVVVNMPHNPTGFLMGHDEQQALVQLCEERGILLFSDEVYRYSEPDTALRLPAACDLGPSAVSLGVLSKSFGLAGLRLGWIATRHRELYQRLASHKDFTTICAPAPSEFLATIALRHRETLLERNRQLLARNLHAAEAFFARHTDLFAWTPPKAGPVAFPRLLRAPHPHEGPARDMSRLVHSDTAPTIAPQARPACEAWVREGGVLLVPGCLFGEPYTAHLRIGLGRASFIDALAAWEASLERA